MVVKSDVNIYSKKLQGNDLVLGKDTHFKVKEFACKDGSDQVLIDKKLVAWLEYIRQVFNKPIIINSGYRTKPYNKKVGGASNSYHVKGRAADIRINGVKPIDIARAAEALGILGIGCYEGFVHVDTREKKSFWFGSEQKKTGSFM